MIRVTASKAGLLPVCQYVFRDGTPWLDTPGRAAIDGQTFHSAVAPIVDGDLPAYSGRLSKWVRKRLDSAVAWLENNPGSYHAEMAFAYDTAKGAARILGKNIGREYDKHGRTATDVVGAADFVEQREDGSVHVFDWKTGRAVTDAVWPQMEMLGLLAARAYNARHVVLRPLHVTEFVVEDGMVREMDADALLRLEAAVLRDVAAIPDAWPTYGAHCDQLYCPARKACGVYEIRNKETA